MTNRLRSYLKKILEEIAKLPVYFFRANDAAEYPYVVFSLEEYTSVDFVVRNYRLTIEIFSDGSPREALDAAEMIRYEFLHFYDRDADFTIAINPETPMSMTDDSEKSVSHVIGTYDIRLVARKDEA